MNQKIAVLDFGSQYTQVSRVQRVFGDYAV